jgi:N-acetyl-beta-hexosaminidase
VDPLGPHFDISGLRPLKNLTPQQSKYLMGILLDAGRHYFEVEWIKQIMDVLAVLQYNLIHFRLTDNQAFHVQLDSQPDLAYLVHLYGNNKTYTPNEL